MKQLTKKYPSVIEFITMLLQNKMMSLGDIVALCEVDKLTAKEKILPKLMREGVLERYGSMYKANSAKAASLLSSLGKKVHTVHDIQTIGDFCKMPNAKEVIMSLISGATMRISSIASTLHISKQDATVLSGMLVRNKVITHYGTGAYRADDVSEACEILDVNAQTENTKAHNKTLVPWKWFTEDINRLRVVLKVVSMDAQGRHIDSVKASAIAGELGIKKSEFVASYAPTLVYREAIAQTGKEYTRGARFKEYVRIITAEADAETPYIGGKCEPKKLTPAQKRKIAQTTKASIKHMEKKRANALEIAEEWHESGLLTNKEHQMRMDEINSEYDALIKNLSQTGGK